MGWRRNSQSVISARRVRTVTLSGSTRNCYTVETARQRVSSWPINVVNIENFYMILKTQNRKLRIRSMYSPDVDLFRTGFEKIQVEITVRVLCWKRRISGLASVVYKDTVPWTISTK